MELIGGAKSMHAFCKFHAVHGAQARVTSSTAGERLYRHLAAPVGALAQIRSTLSVLYYCDDCGRPSDCVEPLRERTEVRRARAAREFLAVAKQDQRRNAADAELAGQLLILVRIELAHLQLRASLDRRPDRAQAPSRDRGRTTAPRNPRAPASRCAWCVSRTPRHRA